VKAHNTATRYLQVVGALLIALGLVHLVATPHILELLLGSSPSVYERAVGPTLLNHVLVGVLLLPLGFSTWLAAMASECGEQWAKWVLIAKSIAVLALPLSTIAFMRRREYYTAPLFLTAVVFVFVISLMMIGATVSLLRKGHR